MSVICGIHIPGKGTYIGSDGRSIAGTCIVTDSLQKWVELKSQPGTWVAASGPYEATAMLKRYSQSCTSPFRDWLCECIKGSSLIQQEASESGVKLIEASFLVATGSGLYYIARDLSVTEIEPNTLFAIGAGSSYAEGFWYGYQKIQGLRGIEISTTLAVELALEVACKFNVSCGGKLFTTFIPEESHVE